MARAYIVLNRNDLPDNLLQVLDLKPNSSQFLPAYDGQDGGQTGYQTWWPRDAAVNSDVATTNLGGGTLAMNGTAYGLAAYLIDNVENNPLGTITAANANAARNSILAKVAAGTALTAAEIADSLTNNGVSNANPGSSLTAGNSTGSVEEVLRILAGEVYRVLDDAQVQLAGAFNGPNGAFVTRPNVEVPASERGVYGAVRGRKSTAPIPYLRSGELRAGQTPVQTGDQDTLFRDVRVIVDTGELHLSALSGALADLKAATFSFENPSFTYGGSGTARDMSNTVIPTTHLGRAVVIYDASGNII